MNSLNLGDKVRDLVTGLEGIVVCESQWLHGCRRLSIQPQETKDGKVADVSTFDEKQLVLVAKSVIPSSAPSATKQAAPVLGGPAPSPSRNPDPTR